MILRAYAANDLDSVSLNTLDHHIVEWLHRKGFQTAEDVRELQDLSPTKSLIEACFMLMVLIPKHYTDVDRKVFEVKAKRSKKPKPRTIPEEIASAIRQLFEKKLSIMLGENRVQPHLPHSSKPLEIESTLIDGNAVQPHIETELDSESYDPIEGDTAEILPLLEDGSKTRHWMPNPVGVGLSQTLASVGGNNTWARKREETATGLLTGTRSFYPVTGKRTPYISLAGWTVSIIVSFPVSEKSAVFVKAEISPPGTRHEHTCFDSSPARLSRLAFRIKTVSSNGESFFWAQRVEFEKQEMLEKLFDRLSSESDGNRATNSSE
ncbi:hypothetical protein H2204_006589 [Knufia peltigerae]|uniref:Uncharacterized protein n=1 Tax=Knufia peltigerae TaxID=1002370 RepID=A0AA38Y3G6_9EURO|nr:hypothetical protein H2204_006589 [Knufia peltigerae]